MKSLQEFNVRKPTEPFLAGCANENFEVIKESERLKSDMFRSALGKTVLQIEPAR